LHEGWAKTSGHFAPTGRNAEGTAARFSYFSGAAGGKKGAVYASVPHKSAVHKRPQRRAIPFLIVSPPRPSSRCSFQTASDTPEKSARRIREDGLEDIL